MIQEVPETKFSLTRQRIVVYDSLICSAVSNSTANRASALFECILGLSRMQSEWKATKTPLSSP